MAATKTRLLSVQDVVDEYGYTERQVRRLVAERKVKFHKPGGRTGHVMLFREDLERFIDETSTDPRR